MVMSSGLLTLGFLLFLGVCNLFLCLDCPLLSSFGYRLTDMTGVTYAKLLTGMSGVNYVKVYLTD